MRAGRLTVYILCFLSASVATAFAQNVVINEIHYNPQAAAGADAEFLELYNAGAAPANIGDWSLTGVTYTFPSNTTIPTHGYLVITKNTALLQAATGFNGALQWTSGSLDNGGETITLLNSALTAMDSVQYDDVAPWPSEPDGNGPSLELINPAFDNNAAGSWRASTTTNGTPGAQNTAFSSAPILSGVVPARHSAVSTLTQVSVTFNTPVSGVVASNLVVGGSAATTVNPPAGPAATYTFSGFAAPASGSVTIALAGGSIQAGGIAFVGDTWTIAVGVKVVMNEIHYHPADPNGNAEFIEFYNTGATQVDMSGWQMSAGIDIVFPNGTTIAAGGYRVIAKDPSLLESVSGFAGALPWVNSSSLSNGGETLTLSDADGNQIDIVDYSDGGSWPKAADGDGPSAELVNPGLPNQFGPAWKASTNPNGTPGAQNSVFLASVPPIILGAKHAPIIPAPNAAVTITATVLDDSPNPTVTLYYRQDADPTVAYISTPMLDDGAHSDGAAGDNVYGAVVPGLPNDQRLDFTIRASDGTNTSAAPPGHNTLGAGEYPFQTYLCKFSNAVLSSDLPSYHMITTQRTANLQTAHNENEYDATFIHCSQGGPCELFYNVTERYRGQSSLGQHPHSFRIDLPADHPLTSEMGFETTHLILTSQSVDKQFLGMQFFREAFGGIIPTPKSQLVRLNTQPLSHGGVQDFVYHNIERVDDDFTESQGGAIQPARFPDICSGSLAPCTSDAGCPVGQTCVSVDHGNVYRARNNGALLEWEGTDPAAYHTNSLGTDGYQKETNEEQDEWTDLITLCDALWCSTNDGGSICNENNYDGSYEANLKNVADTDEWVKWFAIHMLLVNQEGGIYRDTGDDYLLYFQPTGSPNGYRAKLMPWDMDSTFGGFADTFDPSETIWRTTVPSVQRFLRHNAFAGRFVKAICDMLNNEFSQATMNAKIDALPNALANAARKTALKNYVTARRNAVLNEIKTQVSIVGLPASPYTNPNPAIAIQGQLNQCGTRFVTVNGQPADSVSVFNGTWSKFYTLSPGVNNIVVKCTDENGALTGSAQGSVIYQPPTGSLQLTVPTRMINTKTLTLKAELLDSLGRIDWKTWALVGSVSATRVSDNSPVPTSITVFETLADGIGGGTPAPDSIRLYNGVGSVSITLDNGAAEPAGDIRIMVTVNGVAATKVVTVLSSTTPGLYRSLSGALTGPNLTWGPGDGVIRLTGSVSVGAGSTLSIQAGTLVMVDAGPAQNGTAILVNGGDVNALGTQANPIFFFPTNGPSAMTLPQNAQNNTASWRGIHHTGSGTGTYTSVFITGAGNASVTGHPRPPILRVQDSYSITLADCMLADCPGMGMTAAEGASGTYNLRRCLFSRLGIGGEWLGTGYHLTIEDSWFCRIGRAPEANFVDGDILHVDKPGNTVNLRRSILVDCGDDMIDHSMQAAPIIEDCIFYDARDKLLSMDGTGTFSMTNCLAFSCPGGIRCNNISGTMVNCTLGTDTQIVREPPAGIGINCGAATIINKCIFWPNSHHTCCGTVNYTIVGTPVEVEGCGTGNSSVDPLFIDAPNRNYNLQAGSPARNAGPGGTRIGWLGFPSGVACTVDANCNDGNACTQDYCDQGVCSAIPIVGCTPCVTNGDCNDGDLCNGTEVCDGSGACQPGTPVDCGAQTCDPGSGQCVDCTINGDCDDGDPCNGVETCVGGHCMPGTPVDCSYLDGACTIGVCDAGACTAIPANDGGSCDDGKSCTSDDSCSSGVCAGVESCPPGFSCGPNGGCVGQPISVTFQQGVDGYTGTQDTFLQASLPNQINGALESLEWDGQEAGANTPVYTLIRFESIFGSGPGQIPTGVQIISATLTYTVGGSANSTGDAGDLRQALVTWNEATVTYGNFGGDAGAQADEFGASSIATLDGSQAATFAVNVTSSIQTWYGGVASNFGWIVLPTNTNGVEIFSSEYAGNIAQRPILSVIYAFPAPECTQNEDCTDGDPCNGEELCVSGVCQDGPPMDCDDGLACTTDTCDPVFGCQYFDACPVGQSCISGVCVGPPPAPTVEAVGPRYLSITPPSGLSSVAVRVESGALSCLPKYVDADGFLVDAPVFQSSDTWGTLLVADRAITPGTQYDIRVDGRAETDPPNLSNVSATTTWPWGNVNNTDGVDLFDAFCVLQGFSGDFGTCALESVDLDGVGHVPDHVVDLIDILSVLDAYSGLAYPDALPCDNFSPILSGTPSAASISGLLMLVADRDTITPGEPFHIDVFIHDVSNLRGYQVTVEIVAGSTGQIVLDDMTVDENRSDYVFDSQQNLSAVNMNEMKLANALYSGGVDSASASHLATLTLHSTAQVAGTFVVKIKPDPATLLYNSSNQPIDPGALPLLSIKFADDGTTGPIVETPSPVTPPVVEETHDCGTGMCSAGAASAMTFTLLALLSTKLSISRRRKRGNRSAV